MRLERDDTETRGLRGLGKGDVRGVVEVVLGEHLPKPTHSPTTRFLHTRIHRTEGKTMAIQKALETLCYVNGCGLVAIESAQIHVETGGSVSRQLLDAPSL